MGIGLFCRELLGSWEIPEAKGGLLLKCEAGAGTPFPAAQRCHCGCQPGSAAGNQKNQAVPVQEKNQSQNRTLSPLQSEDVHGSLICYFLHADNYLVNDFHVPNGENIGTIITA